MPSWSPKFTEVAQTTAIAGDDVIASDSPQVEELPLERAFVSAPVQPSRRCRTISFLSVTACQIAPLLGGIKIGILRFVGIETRPWPNKPEKLASRVFGAFYHVDGLLRQLAAGIEH